MSAYVQVYTTIWIHLCPFESQTTLQVRMNARMNVLCNDRGPSWFQYTIVFCYGCSIWSAVWDYASFYFTPFISRECDAEMQRIIRWFRGIGLIWPCIRIDIQIVSSVQTFRNATRQNNKLLQWFEHAEEHSRPSGKYNKIPQHCILRITAGVW